MCKLCKIKGEHTHKPEDADNLLERLTQQPTSNKFNEMKEDGVESTRKSKLSASVSPGADSVSGAASTLTTANKKSLQEKTALSLEDATSPKQRQANMVSLL